MYRFGLLILMLFPMILTAQEEITLTPQTLTFEHDAGDIVLTVDIPEDWFIQTDEFGTELHISNREAYARDLPNTMSRLQAGDYYLNLNALPILPTRADDVAEATAVDLFFRFGISEVGMPQSLAIGDGRDVAIIEGVRIANGSGVALLERRDDTLIYMLALTGSESGDEARTLALRILADTQIGTGAQQTPVETFVLESEFMTQTLVFSPASGDIALSIDLPAGWFVGAVENRPLYRIANYEPYTSEAGASVPRVLLEADDYSLHLQASSVSAIDPDPNATAVELLNRFGISAVADSGAESFGTDDERDVAIIEDLTLHDGSIPIGSGVALLERRGDNLIYMLALTAPESGDAARTLALHILESAEINAESGLVDRSPALTYDTYTYLEDDLIFEYPTGWTVSAARNFRKFVFVLSNLSRAELDSNDLEFTLDDMLVTGFVDDIGIDSAGMAQYRDMATAPCPDPELIDACALFVADAMRYAEIYQDFVTVEPLQLSSPTIETVGDLTLLATLNAAPYHKLLYIRLPGNLQVIGLASRDNESLLRDVMLRLAETAQVDFDALTATADELPRVEQQNADLGANGMEVWGPVDRAMIVTDLAWISEPSFRNLSRTQRDTFDFYVTSDPQNNLESSYVWFRDVPRNIQPGTNDNYAVTMVTFKDGERIDTRANGVFVIDAVQDGRISGSFIGEGEAFADDAGSIRVVFSDVEIPDVAPCLASGTAEDGITFTVNVSAPWDINDTFSDGIWRLRSTDTYDRSQGGFNENAVMLYFYQNDNPEGLYDGHYIGFENIPMATVTEPLAEGETERVVATRRDVSIEGGSGFSDRDGEITLTQTGHTISGSFTIQRGSGSEAFIITGEFSGVPVPHFDCRIIGGKD